MKINKKRLKQLSEWALKELIAEQIVKGDTKALNTLLGIDPPKIPVKDKPKGDQLSVSSCTDITPYGSVSLYLGTDCNTPIATITDNWICCSINNQHDSAILASQPMYVLDSNLGPGTVTMTSPGSEPPCFNMPAGETSFTFAQFAAHFAPYIGFNVETSSPLPVDLGINDSAGAGCLIDGCAHPLANNYNSASPGQGCGDPITWNDYSCCEFTGCGAVATNPPALEDSLTVIGEVTDSYGNTHIATDAIGATLSIDEQQPYWVDNGSCQFGGCTQTTITINNVDYTTTNGPNLGSDDVFIGVTHGDAYSYQGINGNDSPYLGYQISNDGSCTIEVCAESYLDGLTDNLGNVVENTFDFYTDDELVDGFIAINDPTLCNVTVCNDETAQNYYGDWYEGNEDWLILSTENIPSGPCVPAQAPEVEGCTDSEACNYNLNATQNVIGLCTYPEDSCDVCADAAGNIGQVTDGSGQVILDPNCEGCINPLDNANPTNYNENAGVDDGSCVFNYCWLSTDEYQTILEANGTPNWANYSIDNYACGEEETFSLCIFDGAQCTTPCPDGQPTIGTGTYPEDISYCDVNIPGCTNPNACNYNSSANTDDGSCFYPPTGTNCSGQCLDGFTLVNGSCTQTIYGCTHPGFQNYEPTANTLGENENDPSNPCQFVGCMDNGKAYESGIIFISEWDTYVCNLGNFGSTEGVSSYQQTGPNPDPATQGEITLSLGEWLCACGDYPSAAGGSGELCENGALPNASLGQFLDYEDGTMIYDSNQGGFLSPTYNGDDILGSCSGGGQPGCNNAGNATYVQNLEGLDCLEYPDSCITVDLDPWSLTNQDDGSCIFYGCTNPSAANYFCIDNPNACIGGEINPQIGVLEPSNNVPCVWTQTYNCSKTKPGCVDPGDGTGEFSSLQQCQQYCRICSNVEVHECGDYNNTRNYRCVEIDGDFGQPNVNHADALEGRFGNLAAFKLSGLMGTGGDQFSEYKPGKIDTNTIWRVDDISLIYSTEPRNLASYVGCLEDAPGPDVPVAEPEVPGCGTGFVNQTATCNYDPNATQDYSDGVCIMPGDPCQLDENLNFSMTTYSFNNEGVLVSPNNTPGECVCEVTGCMESSPGYHPDVFGYCADGSFVGGSYYAFNPEVGDYYAFDCEDENGQPIGYALNNYNPYATIEGLTGCDFITGGEANEDPCDPFDAAFDCQKCEQLFGFNSLPSECTGCTDVNSYNYNPDVIYDDGSCDYYGVPYGIVSGCMDGNADNYNPEANNPIGVYATNQFGVQVPFISLPGTEQAAFNPCSGCIYSHSTVCYGGEDIYLPAPCMADADEWFDWDNVDNCITAASDIRLKENINKTGISKSGIPIYTFNYKNDNTLWSGTMAQDLLSMGINEAVSIMDNGYYKVDYCKIDVNFKKLC